MATIPFALSIHHFISSVGADAGFASIIGLAILVFLFFAQMRETATLRERAEQDAERLRQVEGRLAHVLRNQGQPARPAPVRPPTIGQPLPAAAAAQGAATAKTSPPVAAPRIAPAGVGAPALTAATRLIPTADQAPRGGTALAPPPAPGAVPGGASVNGGGTPASTGVTPAFAGVTPPPADVAPAPATVAGGNGAGRLAAPPPRVQIGQPGAGGRREVPPLRELAPESGASPGRRVLYAVAGAIVIAAIVVGLLSLTSGGGTTGAKAPAKSRSHHRAGTVTVNPRAVTVVVLNGTATFHAATDIATRLQAIGFKRGEAPTNAPEQTHQTTIVQYLPGHRIDALAVAKALKLSPGRVSRIDSGAQLAACPPQSGVCRADVVVTVGADLAATAASSTTGASAPSTSTSAPGAVTSTTP